MATQADFFLIWDQAEATTKRQRKSESYERYLMETSEILIRAGALVTASGIDQKDLNAEVPGLDEVIAELKDILGTR
jgi:hypothetical protein